MTTATTPKPATKVTYEKLRFSDCVIDPRVQRAEDPTKLQKMIDEFEPEALGQKTVNRRDTGVNVLLDGQHRGKASDAYGYDVPLRAKVYHGLTLPEEARLFRLLNNTTKAGVLALFNVAITEGDPLVTEINLVLREYNLKAAAGSFAAVAMAQRVCARPGGLEHFRWAIDTYTQVWNSSDIDGRIVEAMTLMRARYGTDIDTENFVKKLKKTSAGAAGIAGILGDARTYKQVRGGRIQTNVADALVVIYNKNLQKYKLPDWQR